MTDDDGRVGQGVESGHADLRVSPGRDDRQVRAGGKGLSPGWGGENLLSLRNQLLDWFAANQRDLPWRCTYDPYQVWVSEIMGQQTQMSRVVVYFLQWIRMFPNVAAVAAAPEQQLIKAWEGLGYYSRVRNLRRAAQIIMETHGGKIPDTKADLLALPGIGAYTAAAILSIGFNRPYPLIDANVERLFARLADLDMPLKQGAGRRLLQAMAEALLDRGQPRACNQALMEFGALVCTPKNPACSNCSLRSGCQAYKAGTVPLRPLPTPGKQRIDIVMSCGIIIHQGRCYIQQRLPDDIWGGLWEFPGGSLDAGETPEQAMRREIMEETGFAVGAARQFRSVVHHYTRYRVTLHSFFCTLAAASTVPVLHAASQYRWASLDELAAHAFPAGHRQLIASMKPRHFQVA